MTDASAKPANDMSRLSAPGFITFTDVTPPNTTEPEFVICNEATGKFFLANRPTVQFFVAIRETGSVAVAVAKSGIPAQHGDALVKRLIQSGLLVQTGVTQSDATQKSAPLESKLISLRWDIIDASRITRAFGGLGRVLYSPIGYLAWVAIMVAMVQALLSNPEKIRVSLTQIFDAGWMQLFIFGLIYVALKIVHEMGHALAYRTMCLREGLSPGPIRMGISVFAFTPFPFTDVTGAWRIKSVARRVMIGAGGIYFETWIIAALTLFWASTQAGMVQTIILQVAVFAGVLALLFNLNPAIKLDGYYMLTDYLRRPNLSGRASQAARSFVIKAMGAKTAPIVLSDLTYWVLSYAYRWTIFGGIFWLIYQFDPRLAPVAAGLVVVTLVIRPLFNTVKLALKSGIRPLRSLTVLFSVGMACAALVVPFADRILIPGQMRLFETRFIETSERGQLHRAKDGRLTLRNPELSQQIADIGLQADILRNLNRSALKSATERARLTAQITSLKRRQTAMQTRLDDMVLNDDPAAIWTSLDADILHDAWITPTAATVLGAQSMPTQPYLQLRLDQAALERDLPLDTGAKLRVRAVHDPACEFTAHLQGRAANRVAERGQVILRATVQSQPGNCATALKNGGAVVARLDTKPRSLLARMMFRGSRLLQDRLPIGSN